MKVKIIHGKHGDKLLENETFTLAKPGIHLSIKGAFVLVDGTGNFGFPQRRFRIHIASPNDAVFENPAEGVLDHSRPEVEIVAAEESDDDIKARIKERFDILQQMTISASKGTVQGMIVSGAPGVGKSYEIEHSLQKDSLFDTLSFNADADDQDERRISKDGSFRPRYEFIKGYMSGPGLYRKLYDYSAKGEVLAFDDCDALFFDENSLNLIKAALDTTRRRQISWVTSEMRDSEYPSTFTYEGSIVIITNINFEKTVEEGRGKLVPHMAAMMDRCFYMDMTIDTLREKLLRIEQVALDFGMLRNAGLDRDQAEEVMQFVREHAKAFRALSLRKVVQLADLYKIGGNWQRKAHVTLMRTR